MTTARRWQLRRMHPEEMAALYDNHISRDFPSAERPPRSALVDHVENGLQQVFLLNDGVMDTAYAVCAESNETVLVTLLAVFSSGRGRGRGTALLRLLQEHYAGMRAILLEVEDPAEATDGGERVTRNRRIAFYRRAGYVQLDGLINTCFGVRLKLLALPLAASPRAVRQSAADDIQAIYRKILPKRLWPQVVTTDSTGAGQADRDRAAPFGESGAKAFDSQRRIERAAIIGGHIHDALHKMRGGRVLDYGCGTGLVSLPFGGAYREVVLMDASAAMIGVLTEKINHAGVANLRPVVGDLPRCKLDGPFDAVYSSMVLHHIDDLPTLLVAFYAMLAQGGRLCVVDLDTDSGLFHAEEPDFRGHHGFSHAKMRALLKGAGFHGVRIETFYRGEKEIRGARHPYSLFLATGDKA